jgi:hypothetical protein
MGTGSSNISTSYCSSGNMTCSNVYSGDGCVISAGVCRCNWSYINYTDFIAIEKEIPLPFKNTNPQKPSRCLPSYDFALTKSSHLILGALFLQDVLDSVEWIQR